MNRRTLSALALALSLSACGDDAPTPTPDTTADTTPSEDINVPTGECLPNAPASLLGTWAMEERQTALVTNVPGIGTMNQLSTSLYLATIDDEGDALTITVELCDWRTADDSGLTTTGMTTALLNALTPMTRTIALGSEDGAATFTTSVGIALRGLNLEDLADEAFPTETDDPRIFDQDSDGNPGVTLVLGGLFQGELYVAHRHKAALDGCFLSADRVEGLTAWTTEQIILGASDEALVGIQPNNQTHPDPSLSNFTLIRSEGTATCAALRAARDDFDF